MKKNFNDPTTTKIRVEPSLLACRPMEKVILRLAANRMTDIGVELVLPLDVHMSPAAPVIRGGTATIELWAALPGRYTIRFKSATGGAGDFLIETEENKVHLIDKTPYPIAELDVRWGAAKG